MVIKRIYPEERLDISECSAKRNWSIQGVVQNKKDFIFVNKRGFFK